MRYKMKVLLYCVLFVFSQLVVYFVAQGLVAVTVLFPPYSYVELGLVQLMGHTILAVAALILWLYNFPEK